MKIAAAQLAIAVGDVETNYINVEQAVEKAAKIGADLVALPEMWNTAFHLSAAIDGADQDGQRTIPFLQDLARTYGVHIFGGSVANQRGDKLYNTTYVVDRDGKLISTYDKVHLFSPGHEDDVFTPGSRPNIFTLGHITMASITCYDLRFPEWVRVATLQGAQILFVPAAWPFPRDMHWSILNQARAIENQCFVVAINNCGVAANMDFCGYSAIIDPLGEILAKADTKEDTIMADVDVSQIASLRQGFRVFDDRRPDLYTFD